MIDWNSILIAVAIVAGIGIVAGLGLAIASVLLAVPKDEREEQVRALLPGANCGACGYSGCDGYAAALAKGEAENGLCAPGGSDAAAAISALLGIGGGSVERKVAIVHCRGTYDNTDNKLEYEGVKSCTAANQMFGGVSECPYGCMGLGDCVSACDFGAISVCNGAAHVDPNLCKACGKCVKACPKGLISLIPVRPVAVVLCMNCDKGAQTRKVCKGGCIGCMKCTKVCETGAVTVTNFHASVDPDKCTGCGKCAEQCPMGCLRVLSH